MRLRTAYRFAKTVIKTSKSWSPMPQKKSILTHHNSAQMPSPVRYKPLNKLLDWAVPAYNDVPPAMKSLTLQNRTVAIHPRMISNRNVTKKHAVLTTQPFKLSFEFQKDRRKPPPQKQILSLLYVRGIIFTSPHYVVNCTKPTNHS